MWTCARLVAWLPQPIRIAGWIESGKEVSVYCLLSGIKPKKRQSCKKKVGFFLRDDYIPDLLLLLCRWFGIFFRFRSASSSRSPWRSFFFFLCGHEKNNFPRWLLTCNTVENGVPIDESGAPTAAAAQQPRERERERNRKTSLTILSDWRFNFPSAGRIDRRRRLSQLPNQRAEQYWKFIPHTQ